MNYLEASVVRLHHLYAHNTPRTINYLRQMGGVLVFKSLAVAFSFLIVPILIGYLGNEIYGLWATLLSVFSWVSLFDLGLGMGTRNKMAESLARGEVNLARAYLSTSYVCIGAISLVAFLTVLVTSAWIDWQTVFNTTTVSGMQMRRVVVIVAFFILMHFVLKLVLQVFQATQKASLDALNQLLVGLLTVTSVYVISRVSTGNIEYVATAYGLALVGSISLLSVFYYRTNRALAPALQYFEARRIREVFGLGAKIFVTQVAALVIFSTDRMIITQLFGPEDVTPYDVTYRLFSVVTFIHSIIVIPLWSTFTEAYMVDDRNWMKVVLKTLNLILLPFIGVIGLLAFFAHDIIRIWVGDSVQISTPLISAIGLLVTLLIWNNIYSSVLGGISKVRLGMLHTAVSAALNIPLSIYFAKTLDFGVAGVALGTACSIALSAVISPIQVYYFVFSRKRTPLMERLLS